MSNMGLDVSRETRHFDAETGSTSSLRKKEYEDDYGYIDEPDLVRIQVDEPWIQQIRDRMPELPDSRIERFVEQYGISRLQARIIVNTGLQMSRFFEESCRLYHDPKIVANWLVTFLLKSLNYEGITLKESKVKPETFVELLKLIDEGTISERTAKELIKDYTLTGKSPRRLVEEKKLGLLSENELIPVIMDILNENRKAVQDYQDGRKKVVDYLIGQVLRRVKARATVEKVRILIVQILESMPR